MLWYKFRTLFLEHIFLSEKDSDCKIGYYNNK